MNEEAMKFLQTTNKDEIAEYLFERMVVDLALEAREIINKILTRQYNMVDGEKLTALAKMIEGYTKVGQGEVDPKLPAFLGQAFTKFAEKFAKSQSEPMIQGISQ